MAKARLDFDVNFRTRGNFNQLNSSLNKLRYGVDRAAGAFETPAINVANPINDLSNALGKNRLTFRQFGQVIRNSNRILDEHNAIANATGKVFKDAAGNAQVFLDVNRVMYRDTATASQRMRLYATAISGASQSLINLGKNVQWAGRQVMIGITLPMVAAGRQAIRFAERYDREMTRVVKVTNLATHRITTTLADGTKGLESAFDVSVQTEEMRARLELAGSYIRRQTQDLAEFGANLGFLSYKTAEAAAEFAQMGYAGNALTALTRESLTLSRVSGTELLTSVQLVRLAVQAFGNDISDLEETFARLNMIENNTALALNEMATAIPIVASVADNLGISIERLAGFLAIMKEKGIAASEGATAFRTGLIKLIQKPTRNATIAFDRINLSLDEMQSRHRGDVTGFLVELAQTLDEMSGSGAAGQRNVEAFTQALSTLTGVRASARFLSLVTELKDLEKVFDENIGEEVWRIKDGVEETAPIVRALIGEFTEGSTALAVYRYELERVNTSLAGTADRLRAQMSVEIQKIGRRFLVVSNQLREFAVSIMRAFNNLSEATQNTVFGFGVVIASVGPLAMVFGVLANAIGQIISFFSKFFRKINIVTTAQRAEELAFSATNKEIEYQVALKNSLVSANSRLSASSAALSAATLGLRPGRGEAPGFIRRTQRYPGKEVYDSVYQDLLKGIKNATGSQKASASLTAIGSSMAAVVSASILKILPGADIGRLTQVGSEVGVSMVHDFFEGMQHQWEKETRGFIADMSLPYPKRSKAPDGSEIVQYLPLGYGTGPEITQQVAERGLPRTTFIPMTDPGLIQRLRDEYAELEAQGNAPMLSIPQQRDPATGRFIPGGGNRRMTFSEFFDMRTGRDRPTVPDITDAAFARKVLDEYNRVLAEGNMPTIDTPAPRGPGGRFTGGATSRPMTFNEFLRAIHHGVVQKNRPQGLLPLFDNNYIYPDTMLGPGQLLPHFESENVSFLEGLLHGYNTQGRTGAGFESFLPLAQGTSLEPLGPGLLPAHLRKRYPIDDVYMRYFARMATSEHPGASMALGGRVVDRMQLREGLGLAPALAAGTKVRGISGWSVAGTIQDDFQVTMNEILYQAAAQQRLGVGGKTIVDDAMGVLEDHITMQMRSPKIAQAIADGEGSMVDTMFDRMRQSVATRLQYFSDPKMPARVGYYKQDPVTGAPIPGEKIGRFQGMRIPFLTQQRLDGLMGRTEFEAPSISRAQMNANLEDILRKSYEQMEREGRAPDMPMDLWVSRNMKKQTGFLSRLKEFRTVTGGTGLKKGQALPQGMTPFLTGARKGAEAGLNWNKLLLSALIMPIKGPFMAVGKAFTKLLPKVAAFGTTLAKSGGIVGSFGKFLAAGAGMKAGVLAGLAAKLILPVVIVFGGIAMSSPKDFMAGMKKALSGPLEGLRNAWGGFINQINRLRLAFSSVGGEAGAVASAIAKWFGTTVGNIFGAFIRLITALLNIFQSLFKLIETIGLLLRGDFTAALKGIKDFIGLLGAAFLNTFASILGGILGWIPGMDWVIGKIGGLADHWTEVATATDYATDQLLKYKGVLDDVNAAEKDFATERAEIESAVRSMISVGLVNTEDLGGMSEIWEGFDRFSSSQEEEAERIRRTIDYVEEKFGGLPDEMKQDIVAFGMLDAEQAYFDTIQESAGAAASALSSISEQANRGFLGRFSNKDGARAAQAFLDMQEPLEEYEQSLRNAEQALEDWRMTGAIPEGVRLVAGDEEQSLQELVDAARQRLLEFRTENAAALSAPFEDSMDAMRPGVEAVGQSLQSEVDRIQSNIDRMVASNLPLRAINQERARLSQVQNRLDEVNVALLGDGALMSKILLEYSEEELATLIGINERIQEQIELKSILAQQEEAGEVEDEPDYSEYISAMQSAMQEVVGDITTSISNILGNQESMISEHFKNIATAAEEYFSQYTDQLKDQTDLIKDALKERNDAELQAINSIADAQIEAIEEVAEKEEELDRKRKQFFDRENARIEYLRRRRTGEIEIEESILRGDIGKAAIMQIERDLAAQEYYNKILQDREEDLRILREEARQQEIERIEEEREEATRAAEDMLGLQETLLEESIRTSDKLAETYERRAEEEIEKAQKAAEEASAAERQRIENYLREWQRNIPASEAEFAAHQKKLQEELDKSASSLAGTVNGINSQLNSSLAKLSSEFVTSNRTIMTELEIGFVDVEKQYLSSSNSIIKSISSANVTVTNSVDNMLRDVGASAYRVETQLINVRNRFYSEMSGLLGGLGSTITNTEQSLTGSFMGIDTKYGELAGNLDLTSAQINQNFSDASANLEDRFSTALSAINQDLSDLNDENEIRIGETLSRFISRTVPEFSSGLSSGFATGQALVEDFLNTFGVSMGNGFQQALNIAIEQFVQKEKWERAGADLMEAIQKGIDDHPLSIKWDREDASPDWMDSFDMDAHARRIYEANKDMIDSINNNLNSWARQRGYSSYREMYEKVVAGQPLNDGRTMPGYGPIDQSPWGQYPPAPAPVAPVTPQPTTPPPSTPSRQTVSTSTSGVNSDVRLLQQALNRFASAGLTVDGRFGSATRNAVISYQRSKSLAPDGIVGSATWSALRSDDTRAGRPLRIHTGGLVGSRLPSVGASYGIKSDEISAILQKGEYVVNKSAVSRLGVGFMERLNSVNKMFSGPAVSSISVRSPGGSQEGSKSVYNLSFEINGANIDESDLARKVVFEIKKMERSTGAGRRVMSR